MKINYNKIIRNIYYITKRFTNGTIYFFKELFQPTSFLKGDDFEACLRKRVFTKDLYDLVMKTHDFHENKKDYVESSLHPDYLFREKDSNNEFWVEAKYREKLFKGKIEWCSNYQLKRYKKLSMDLDVVIAIGFSGRPSNPDKIYLIPLREIRYTGLYPNKLKHFEFEGKRKNILDSLKDKVYDYERSPYPYRNN